MTRTRDGRKTFIQSALRGLVFFHRQHKYYKDEQVYFCERSVCGSHYNIISWILQSITYSCARATVEVRPHCMRIACTKYKHALGRRRRKRKAKKKEYRNVSRGCVCIILDHPMPVGKNVKLHYRSSPATEHSLLKINMGDIEFCMWWQWFLLYKIQSWRDICVQDVTQPRTAVLYYYFPIYFIIIITYLYTCTLLL